MRDQLIGYLLGALEPFERVALERKLAEDASLRQELQVLQRSLVGLDADRGHYDPPEGLTERTMEFLAEPTLATSPVCMTPDRSPPNSRSRWSLADLVVSAGVLIAASLIFIPAVNQSRQTARITGCQNNLRQIGVALTTYSESNNRFFPHVPSSGPLAAAGVYAHALVHGGFLDDPHLVICPASALADDAKTFHVPTSEELQKAESGKLAEMQRSMGGSYGYTLGYISKGRYHPEEPGPIDLRADGRFANVAPTSNIVSANHGPVGQNVLFEDGHVETLSCRMADGCGDDIFLNDQGEVSAGTHRDDAVIAPSPAKPIIWPVALQGE